MTLRRPLRLVHDGPGEQAEPEPDEFVPGAVARIHLGGGGSADDESALWQCMLHDGMRIAYWPFALEPSSYDAADLGQRSEHDLDGVDLLWVGGGNTYALLDHVRSTGWVDLVRAHVLRGGAYYGGSAGAVLAGADIDVARFADPNDVGLTDTTGLCLLGRAIVRPHWTDDADSRIEAWGWATRLDCDVLAIPDDAGVVVVDGLATNVGPARVDVVRDGDVIAVYRGEAYLVHRSRR